MKEQVFKRKKRIWQMTIILGLFSIYYGFSASENNFIPANIKYILGVLMFLYGIWSFFTPYLIINESNIIIKKDIISVYKIEITKIEDIDITSDIVSIKYGEKKEKIKLKILEVPDQKVLVNLLKGMINNIL